MGMPPSSERDKPMQNAFCSLGYYSITWGSHPPIYILHEVSSTQPVARAIAVFHYHTCDTCKAKQTKPSQTLVSLGGPLHLAFYKNSPIGHKEVVREEDAPMN